MLAMKKLVMLCVPCPSASIMILQKGIAISLEGRYLVLTLLVSNVPFWILHLDLHYSINP